MSFNTTGLLAPQIPHAQRLIDSLYLNGAAYDGSDTGIGKTYVAACIAKSMNARLVVICPKLVMPAWKKILAQFGVKASLVINFEKLCRGNTPYLKYGKCKKVDRWKNAIVKLPAGSFVIVDEAHRGKGPFSLNAGLIIALKRQGYRSLCLSATAATTATEMKAFGYMLNLHDGGLAEDRYYKTCDFNQFCIDHGAEWTGRYGAMTTNLDSPKVKAAMKELHLHLTEQQQIMSRLTREEMGSLFPENQVVASAYDLGEGSKKIAALYDWMEDEIAKLNEAVADYSGCILAVITKARRQIELLKVPAMLEMTEDLYDEGKSVVLFVNFTDTIELLTRRLRGMEKFAQTVGCIYGGVSNKNRLADIDAFNADRKRIIVANIAAGGQSISLHDLNGKHPRASIINPNYSAYQVLQALGRIHRQGGLTKCYQRFLFAAGTREEMACRRVQSRLNNLSILNDGDLVDGMRFFRFCAGKSI
jgi:hypothetical protein